MDVLYVYEHFDNLGSMNAALRTEAERMLVSMEHTVADSDLYRMKFRHALSNGALSTPSTPAAVTWAAP